MTNADILRIAMEQSAIDANCSPENFAELYLPTWSNALCEKRKHLDVLAVGAYDGGKFIVACGPISGPLAMPSKADSVRRGWSIPPLK
jgi:hypothetical protein